VRMMTKYKSFFYFLFCKSCILYAELQKSIFGVGLQWTLKLQWSNCIFILFSLFILSPFSIFFFLLCGQRYSYYHIASKILKIIIKLDSILIYKFYTEILSKKKSFIRKYLYLQFTIHTPSKKKITTHTQSK